MRCGFPGTTITIWEFIRGSTCGKQFLARSVWREGSDLSRQQKLFASLRMTYEFWVLSLRLVTLFERARLPWRL